MAFFGKNWLILSGPADLYAPMIIGFIRLLLGDFTQPRDLVESLTYRGNYKQQYLDGDLEFPNEPKGFADAIINFEANCYRTRQILTKCAEMAFDLPQDLLANQCSVKDESLRLAHYPDVANPSKQLRSSSFLIQQD